EIARNIKNALSYNPINESQIKKIVDDGGFNDTTKLIEFIENNPLNLSNSTLSRIAELSNTRRTNDGAFYTNKALITEMIKNLPNINKEVIHILEPSAG